MGSQQAVTNFGAHNYQVDSAEEEQKDPTVLLGNMTALLQADWTGADPARGHSTTAFKGCNTLAILGCHRMSQHPCLSTVACKPAHV